MKLYGTITSERASKGQGGKELFIVIRDEKKRAGVAIKVTSVYKNRIRTQVSYNPMNSESPQIVMNFEDEHKGNKQKGEEICRHGLKTRQCMTCATLE